MTAVAAQSTRRQSLILGIATHIFNATLFRSNGAGLPRAPSAAFAILLVIATAMAVLRHGVLIGNMTPLTAMFGFLIFVAFIAYIAKSRRFVCVSLYLCISIGVDLAVMLSQGHLAGWVSGLWELSACAVGFYRCTRETAS